MALSDEQRRKDRADAIIARRSAADMLYDALQLMEKANKKLAYNKSEDVRFELKRVTGELRELVDTLRDPEYDPD